MGYYETRCGTCGGPAIFFLKSFSMSIDCANCGGRYDFLNLLVAWTMKIADDEGRMLSSCTSVDVRSLGSMEPSEPPET
jgi:DNA-directed RNA polymerase subunit RPC12/RpoP